MCIAAFRTGPGVPAGHRLGVRLPKVCLCGSRVPRFNKLFSLLRARPSGSDSSVITFVFEGARCSSAPRRVELSGAVLADRDGGCCWPNRHRPCVAKADEEN